MRLATIIMLILISISLFAQKLPQVQQVSLRAPTNVKVDGKPTEWGSKMQAFNKTTNMFYTIANDDKKLYLIIRSPDQHAGKLVTGITFVIQPTGVHNDKGARLVKYPYFETPGENIWFAFTPQSYSELKGVEIEKDPDGKKTEALIKQANKKLATLSKWIYTRGIIGKDSVISVYNDEGVIAANGFGSDKIYTSELSIDLKLLGLSVDKSTGFSYHLSVNGEPTKYYKGLVNWRANVQRPPNQTDAQFQEMVGRMEDIYTAASMTLDFWGEYTLAK